MLVNKLASCLYIAYRGCHVCSVNKSRHITLQASTVNVMLKVLFSFDMQALRNTEYTSLILRFLQLRAATFKHVTHATQVTCYVAALSSSDAAPSAGFIHFGVIVACWDEKLSQFSRDCWQRRIRYYFNLLLFLLIAPNSKQIASIFYLTEFKLYLPFITAAAATKA